MELQLAVVLPMAAGAFAPPAAGSGAGAGAAAGFGEVTLDCKGELTGWQSVGTAGRYEYVTVDLVRSAEPVGTCRNGPQHAASSQPFGITVWGLDDASSYAYPAGGNVSVLNAVVVAPLI